MRMTMQNKYIKAYGKYFMSTLLILFTGWVFYPPFPPPSQYLDMSYSQLVVQLGPPNSEVPGKFVAWDSNRLIGGWRMWASFDAQPAPNDIPGVISRHLWIGKIGYSVKFFETSKKNVIKRNSP
jgi:hypothetical protein